MARRNIVDIEHVNGDTLKMLITISLSDGTPVDLTGSTVDLEIYETETPDTVFYSFSSPTGITVLSNTITVSHIVDIARDNYHWRLTVNFLSGVVTTYITGKFKLI